eukprot:INCI12835.2.p1 GENE.INCI12835.2~~INCI12835.2.p1  ORF type:complete len:177 (+),score=35.00 INCI12835.2:287-817(+)
MAHIQRFMLYAVRNRIRAILTPRGLAAALAWGGGIKSSSVQLVQLDTERLSQLVSRISLAKKRFKNFFTRCNDVVFCPSPGPCINTIDDVDEAIRARRKFCFHAYACSGIDGTRFEVQLGLKNDEDNRRLKARAMVGLRATKQQLLKAMTMASTVALNRQLCKKTIFRPRAFPKEL